MVESVISGAQDNTAATGETTSNDGENPSNAQAESDNRANASYPEGSNAEGEASKGGDNQDGEGESKSDSESDSKTGEESKEGDAKEGEESKDENDGEKKEDEDEDEKKEPLTVEDYKELKFEEGIEVDEEQFTDLKGFFAEKSIDPEASQELLDRFQKYQKEKTESLMTSWSDTIEGWTEAVKNDKEIGGVKHAEKMALVAKARNAFGTPELNEALDKYGFGNHPEFVRFFHRVGKRIGESGNINDGEGQGGTKSVAERLYPNNPKTSG